MDTSRRSLSVLFFAMIMVSLKYCHGEDGSASALPQTNNAKSPMAPIEHHPVASGVEEQRNKAYYNHAEAGNRNKNNGGRGGGWGWGWGNGGGRGGGGGGGGGGGRDGGGSSSSGGMGGAGGWGWGGGGGGWWSWGCRRTDNNHNEGEHAHKKRSFGNEKYRLGEFAQCMGRGRCGGMRLDCPLHCGGPCLYDCKNMCKAHCRR